MKRVVVIGAGVVGASIAFRLAHAGANVTVVDRAEPASGTTSASFAWINANQKTPREYFELNFEGLKEHFRLKDELGDAPWLHPGGNLAWTGDPARYDELSQRVERLQCWGYNARWLSAADVKRDLEPELQFSGPTMRVAYFPDEAWLDGPRYVRSMLNRAGEHGAEARSNCPVTGMDVSSGGVTVQLDTGESIEADAVVNAAGRDADRIAALVGRRLPLEPTKGLLVRVAVERPLIGRSIHASDVDLRPDGDGYILLHHNAIDPLVGDRTQVPVDDELCRELFKRVRRVLPEAKTGTVVETRVGVRPYPRDGVSCVGGVTGIDGYYEAVTHSGITLGPLLGRLLAQEIMTGNVDPLLHSFRPDRF